MEPRAHLHVNVRLACPQQVQMLETSGLKSRLNYVTWGSALTAWGLFFFFRKDDVTQWQSVQPAQGVHCAHCLRGT